ncbi:hypothetical protein [Neisseria leonii]|nr:hypothetical protein [Neisseria sp. 3986]MDD9325203.1 hypothetical protein [Neisseria sp. 3986]
MKAVVKATQNKDELYLVSLFGANEKEMQRTRKSGAVLFEKEAGG